MYVNINAYKNSKYPSNVSQKKMMVRDSKRTVSIISTCKFYFTCKEEINTESMSPPYL